MAGRPRKNKPKEKKEIIELIEEKPIIIEEPEEEEIKKHKLKINEVDVKHGRKPAFIVSIGGHSKRIYFDLTFKELGYLKDNKNAYINKMLTIYYIGDINNAFNIKILPIRSLSDIG